MEGQLTSLLSGSGTRLIFGPYLCPSISKDIRPSISWDICPLSVQSDGPVRCVHSVGPARMETGHIDSGAQAEEPEQDLSCSGCRSSDTDAVCACPDFYR